MRTLSLDAARQELTLLQLAILGVVSRDRPMTGPEIARALGRPYNAVAHALTRLAKRGHVYRPRFKLGFVRV